MPTASSSESAPLKLRDDRVPADLAQVGIREDQLGQVAPADHAHDRGDHGLEQAHAEPLQPEDAEGRDPGDDRRGKEPEAEKQLEADGRAEELGKVGGHRDQLRLHPQPDRGASRVTLAADLRQVEASGDAELRRQGLDQHRHQARGDHHPDERVAVLRARGDVRGEVPRVDVGDAGDEGRAEEREDPEARPVQCLVDGLETFGQRGRARGDHSPILAMPKNPGGGGP